MSSSLHPVLFKAWLEKFPNKSRAYYQSETNQFWNDKKQLFRSDSGLFQKCIRQKIEELKQETTRRKTLNIQFFLKQVNYCNFQFFSFLM